MQKRDVSSRAGDQVCDKEFYPIPVGEGGGEIEQRFGLRVLQNFGLRGLLSWPKVPRPTFPRPTRTSGLG